MTRGPGEYGRVVPTLASAAAVYGALLWLAAATSAVSGAGPASPRAGAGSGAPPDGAVWARSSAADDSSPDDDDDDEAPAASAAIVTAPLGVALDDVAPEPVLLADVIRVERTRDSHALRGPPVPDDEDRPLSSDGDDDDDDQDDAIAGSVIVRNLSTRSIELADVTSASAQSSVFRPPALRAPPAHTL